jgi:hypothetical protein
VVLPKARAALDIREEEGYGTGGRRVHGADEGTWFNMGAGAKTKKEFRRGRAFGLRAREYSANAPARSDMLSLTRPRLLWSRGKIGGGAVMIAEALLERGADQAAYGQSMSARGGWPWGV